MSGLFGRRTAILTQNALCVRIRIRDKTVTLIQYITLTLRMSIRIICAMDCSKNVFHVSIITMGI